MKVKKETVILILIILGLSTYLVMQKKGKTHYSLPELKPIEAQQVTRLSLQQGDRKLELKRENDQWKILPKNYPADHSSVNEMVDGLIHLTLTALASESGNETLYGLTPKKRIDAVLYAGEKPLRKIEIGKVTSSRQHTFVRVEKDPRIFHAKGNLVRLFGKTASELRDKQILKINGQITGATLTEGDKTITLLRNAAPVQVDATKKNAGSEAKKEAPPAPKWLTDQGEPIKEEEMEDLVRTLSNLQCDDFIENKTKKDFTKPLYVATLMAGKKYTVSLYEKEGNRYAATSSESPYPFYLPDWKAKRIMKHVNDLKNAQGGEKKKPSKG